MKPAKKTCSTPPAHCIRESFTQKKSSICFSLRFLGEWNLLRTRHVYQISICAVEEVNSFGFIAFSFRSEMLISCHDIKTLSGLSFHLLPKKNTDKNNTKQWCFLNHRLCQHKQTTITDHPKIIQACVRARCPRTMPTSAWRGWYRRIAFWTRTFSGRSQQKGFFACRGCLPLGLRKTALD